MPKSVSIVVLNYNGQKHLQKCLPSIFNSNQADITFEVIVVDNNSTDNSLEYIAENFPKVRTVFMDKNSYYCPANNRAAQEAKYPLIFFINNDTEFTDNLLQPLVKHFDQARIFAVSPRILRPLDNMFDEAITSGVFRGGCINTSNETSKKLKASGPLKIFYTCGAAMMVDREKFLELDGFDPITHPFYMEETDICFRAWKMGWQSIYEPAGTIYHYYNQSIGAKVSARKAAVSRRKNQYLFIWKNISDRKMLLSHIFAMLLPKLIIPSLFEWQALGMAFRQLREALKKRSWQKNARLTDREAFAQTAYLEQYLK